MSDYRIEPVTARKAVYVGDDVGLVGRTALVIDDPDDDTRVLAQFDDCDLPEAFGWHPFDVDFFDEVPT